MKIKTVRVLCAVGRYIGRLLEVHLRMDLVSGLRIR